MGAHTCATRHDRVSATMSVRDVVARFQAEESGVPYLRWTDGDGAQQLLLLPRDRGTTLRKIFGFLLDSVMSVCTTTPTH